MSVDLSALAGVPRLLFEIPLRPIQGQRFQPTGFPGLGAATFQTAAGACLLVESAQSMANRLELTCWDEVAKDVKQELQGLSHVRVMRNGAFLTDSILESHRLNSPYLLDASYKTAGASSFTTFFDYLRGVFVDYEARPVDYRALANELLRLDIGSLVHGVFLSQPRSKQSIAGGRLRIARALSAFIEADDVRPVASGGAKLDRVNPSWPKGYVDRGYGHTPFARDEFTGCIKLYVNLDLGQIRGYGLGAEVDRLLTLLALYKLRILVDGSLRLRTACDLELAADSIVARRPENLVLPDAPTLGEALQLAIKTCASRMTVTEVSFNDDLKKGKDDEGPVGEQEDDAADGG